MEDIVAVNSKSKRKIGHPETGVEVALGRALIEVGLGKGCAVECAKQPK